MGPEDLPQPARGWPVERIISGGQTGVDRAALDWAIAAGVPHGGWCPRGRLAEDGVIDPRYALTETEGEDYLERTRRNIATADGTLIIAPHVRLTGGTLATAAIAEELGKPCYRLIGAYDPVGRAPPVLAFIRQHSIRVLNVAGPRASESPGIERFVTALLWVVYFTGRGLVDEAPAPPGPT